MIFQCRNTSNRYSTACSLAGTPLFPRGARSLALTNLLEAKVALGNQGARRSLRERLLSWSQTADYGVNSLHGDNLDTQPAEHDDWLAKLLRTPLFGRLPPSHLHACWRVSSSSRARPANR